MESPLPSMMAVLAAALALAGPASAAHKTTPAQVASGASGCARDCLDALADRFLDAMVARAPAGLPWAGTVRYSENSVPMMIGDGVWATLTDHSKSPLRATDPSTGEVVWIGDVGEHGQPGFLALRLRIVGGKIADAEAVIRRKGGPAQYGDPEHYTHDPAFGSAGGGGLSRARLVAVVDGYFDAVQGKPGARPQIAAGCARLDNGVPTTSGDTADGGVTGCAAQLKAGVFKPIVRVRARRFPVVDEVRGVVVAAGFFDLPATSPKPPAGKGLAWAADYPYSLGFIAAFKIRDGGVYRVDTISNAQPYLMPSPWGGAQ